MLLSCVLQKFAVSGAKALNNFISTNLMFISEFEFNSFGDNYLHFWLSHIAIVNTIAR